MSLLDTMRSGFSRTFWVADTLELFERFAYYGSKAVLAVFIAEQVGLGAEAAGFLAGSVFNTLLYFLPLLAGTVVDRYGFKRSLMACFAIFSVGYFLIGLAGLWCLGFSWLIVYGMRSNVARHQQANAAKLTATVQATAAPYAAAPGDSEKKSSKTNILLLGSDEREGEGGFRTDVILLLSIDVELSEPQVLGGFDAERFRPALVCIEAHPQVRQQILNYFAAHQYVPVGQYLRVDTDNLYFVPLAVVGQ